MITQSQRAMILAGATIALVLFAFRFSGSWPGATKDPSRASGANQNQSAPSAPALSDQSNAAEETVAPERFLKQYLIYSPRAVSDAFARGQFVVLFFYSDASADAKKADEDLKQDIQLLPLNVTVLKASFERDSTLKKRYGITAPDIFLQISRQGVEVTKWLSGGNAITTLKANILRK